MAARLSDCFGRGDDDECARASFWSGGGSGGDGGRRGV